MFSRGSWTPEELPDLSGKVAIVTGGNSGIGVETCFQLLLHGAKVYMASRSESKAVESMKSMRIRLSAITKKQDLPAPGEIEYLHTDLASIRGATEAAQEFIKREKRLDIFIANAGQFFAEYGESEDGVERTIATAHFGHAAMLSDLLPLLSKTSKLAPPTPTSAPNSARIVIVASNAYWMLNLPGALPVNFGLLERINNPRRSGSGMYAQAKLANILFASRLSRLIQTLDPSHNISVLSLHPGSINTRVVQGMWFVKLALSIPGASWLWDRLMNDERNGSWNTLYAAGSREIDEKELGGLHLVPVGRIAQPIGPYVRDPVCAEMLWRTTIQVLHARGAASNVSEDGSLNLD